MMKNLKGKKVLTVIGVAVFWLLLWQLVSFLIHKPYLFASPLDTFRALFALLPTGEFWGAIGGSALRICGGLITGCLFGIAVSALAFLCKPLRQLLSPALRFLQSVPVASFVVLALIWFGSVRLSFVISFTMVFPIFYFTTEKGLNAADPELLEMAKVFRVRPGMRILKIYQPALLPYLLTACVNAVGVAWKSGVAAEIIGLPSRSIGEHLYEAKLYLDTANLFAWTLSIILVSLLTEKISLYLVRKAGEKLGA